MRVSPRKKSSIKNYSLRPTIFPPDFVLCVDTREQRSLFDRIPKGLVLCSKTLTDGDYSVLGLEDKICFERKSIDLYTYISSEREKTIKKMERFREMEFVGLVIEMPESEVYRPQLYTSVHPEVVRAALTSFMVRYGVHIYMGTRANCQRWLLDTAVKFFKVKREG